MPSTNLRCVRVSEEVSRAGGTSLKLAPENSFRERHADFQGPNEFPLGGLHESCFAAVTELSRYDT